MQLQKEARAAAAKVANQITGTGVLSSATSSTTNDDKAKATRAQSELDDAIASECPLCGEVMIESVAVPFVEGGASGSSEWDL